MMDSTDFNSALGKLVVIAAHLEYSLRGALITLCSILKFDDNILDVNEKLIDNDIIEKISFKNRRLVSTFLLPHLQMNRKIELLRRAISFNCSEESAKDWNDLASDLEELFMKRNSYIHGLYGVDDQQLIRLQLNKGKNGGADFFTEEKVEISEILELVDRLEHRHRQLMDFIEDYPFPKSTSMLNVPKSQSMFPRLTF